MDKGNISGKGKASGKEKVLNEGGPSNEHKWKIVRKKKTARKWKPGDRLPDSPTLSQLQAHQVAVLEWVDSQQPEKEDTESISSEDVVEMNKLFQEMEEMLAESAVDGKAVSEESPEEPRGVVPNDAELDRLFQSPEKSVGSSANETDYGDDDSDFYM